MRLGLAPGTINLRSGAVRRLAYEAADSGLLSSDLAAGIRRVKGVRNLGMRLGNWLTVEQSLALWQTPDCEKLKGKRDRALHRMRTLRFVLSLVIIGAAAAEAENKAQTEAQQDGLNGLVHSVSMTNQEILFELDPSGAWVIQYAPSENVEFDSKGYRTKVGRSDVTSGEFRGQMSQFVRDANGLVIERTMTQLPSQDVIEHDVYGPFGLVEATNFSSGKPTFQHTISYDQQGNVREDSTMEGDRKPIFRTLYRRNPDGAWTERTTWLRGELHSHETYNPDADFQRYEEYGESGDVTTAFTYRHNRIESYWSRLNDAKGAISLINTLDNGDTVTWGCHNENLTCDGHTRHGVYLDDARHNPIMIEIFTDDGRCVWSTAWATATDINVLPVPHSPTMIADRAVFRCLATPEMVRA